MINLYLGFYGLIALANGTAGFALSIWIYQSTGSIAAFTSAGIASLLPALILTPVAGLIIDRFGIKNSVVGSSCAIALGWVFLMLFIYLDKGVWVLMPALAFVGAFSSVQMPAYHALIAESVPTDRLTQANGVFGALGALAAIAAPISAGFLAGNVAIFLICLLPFTLLVFQATALSVLAPSRSNALNNKGVSALGDIKRICIFVAGRKGLLAILILGVFINTSAEAAGVLLIPLGIELFDEARVGMLVTFAGVGALLGNALLAVIPVRSMKVAWIVGINSVQGLILIGATQTSLSFVDLSIAIGVFFVLEAIYDGIDLSYWQERAPDNYRASVLSFKTMSSLLATFFGYLAVLPIKVIASKGVAEFSEFQYLGFSMPENSLTLSLAIVGGVNIFVILAFVIYTTIRGTFQSVPEARGKIA